MLKKSIPVIILSLIFSAILIYCSINVPLIGSIHRKVYDCLMKIQYKLKGPPSAISDVSFVVIDNETFRSMKEKWPYPRSSFASVIENLKKAGARVIALDFIFYGHSSDEDDTLLKKALEGEDSKVLLGATIDEESKVNASTAPAVTEISISGIVTKMQDPDTVVRRNLTYLLVEKDKKKCFLSWEMQLLKMTKGIDISSLNDKGAAISFCNNIGERWTVPVESDNKSFLINFRSHTSDFKKLSFYRVLKDDFDPASVKDKIILIGFVSSVFWDFYNTPIGPLPGVTLNANAYLTLYSHDFLTETPKPLAISLVIIGVILASIIGTFFRSKIAFILIAVEILIFFAASLLLFTIGYVWDYSIFPIAVLLCPFLSKKLMDITTHVWLNKSR